MTVRIIEYKTEAKIYIELKDDIKILTKCEQGPPGGGGGSSITVEDEGIELTNAVTKFNFVGAGVDATEPVADEITVTIPGGSNTITTVVTKTVAADGMPAGVQDFDTLEEAILWLSQQTTISNGHIYLVLEDGQHIIDDTHGDYTNQHYIKNVYCTIKSSSGDKSLCIITIASGSTMTNCWFSNCTRTYIRMFNITVDPKINGSTVIKLYSLFSVNNYSLEYNQNCIFTNLDIGKSLFSNSILILNNTEITNCDTGIQALREVFVQIENTILIDNCETGIDISSFSNFTQYCFSACTATISNCTIGIDSNTSSSTTLGASPASIVFTGNITDTNITLNEIQADGGYISDNSGLIYDGGTF